MLRKRARLLLNHIDISSFMQFNVIGGEVELAEFLDLLVLDMFLILI